MKINPLSTIRTLLWAAFFLVLGPKTLRAAEILGHAGWSVSADQSELIWSNPSTKVYRENTRDARQLHTIRQGNRGGIMYINQATGGCLLAHDRYNGAPVGYWHRCNPNDPKMNWYREHVGGGDHRLRNVAYPSQCLDAAVNQEGGNVHMWQCLNVSAQRFRIVQVQTTPHVTSVSKPFQLTLWNGYSLKTNHTPRFAGQYGPVIGLWDGKVDDPDQDFRFEAMSDGGYMLRQGSLNKCLDSTNDLVQKANPIAYPCDVHNPNQRWEKVVVPGGQFLLRRKGTNLCLDSTGQDRNGQKTHLWTCEGNNQNQRFQFGSMDRLDAFYDYEVWLVARRRPRQVPYDGSPGHAFIGVTGINKVTGRREAVRVYSFWPEDQAGNYQEPGTDLTIDFYDPDFKQLQAILRGEQISLRGHAVRKMRFSKERVAWLFQTGKYKSGCVGYVAFIGFYQGCNCMDYSTRLWHYLTGEREDLRIKAISDTYLIPALGPNKWISYDLWPDALVDAINKINQQDGDDYYN